MHFVKSHRYDTKDPKPQNFANNKWHNKDDELFADATYFLDSSKSVTQPNTTQRSYETPSYSIESRISSPFLDISDLMSAKKHHEEDDVTT